MADVFTIDGMTLEATTDDFLPVRFSERFGAIATLTIQRRGVALPGLPDPWVGKEATWTHGGKLCFTGDVVSVTPSFNERLGWVLTYQCLGLRNRLDWFPHTDEATGIDTSSYNLTLEDPSYVPTKAGRTVGDILTDVLTMVVNAQELNAYGIGNYTGLPSSPTLPAATVSDLAALTVIPPRPVYFSGEKFGGAIDAFLQQCAPNHRFWIQPDGVMRVLDIRTFTPTTFTMGTDPIEPSELSRDVGDCFQRVVVRGHPIAVMALLKLSAGTLVENFGHDGLTNAAAKAAWTPADYQQPGKTQDVGTCSCPTTATVTVTSGDPGVSWASGFWDQSHRAGTINLMSTSLGGGFIQFWSARIVNCPALSAGGSCTLTIDNPLPSLNYDHYTITGLAAGGSVVWTRYTIANSNLWPRVTAQSTYPQAFVLPGGGAATLTSAPMGMVLWSDSGSPPYNTFPDYFATYNPSTGDIRFVAPTYTIANNAPPADVWVLVPVFTNPNTAVVPADVGGVPQYDGTSHGVDGLEKTLTVQLGDWRDPSLLSQIADYAADLLDSIKDAVCEGTIVHYGMFEAALTFGMAVNVAGDNGDGAYITGWEALDLAVVAVDVEWPQDSGADYITTLHCSNRRDHATAEMFLHPETRFIPIGTGEGGDIFKVGTPYIPSIDETIAGIFESQKPPPVGTIPTSLADEGIPTTPGEYFEREGIARSPEEYFQQQGIPTSLEEAGIPTNWDDVGIGYTGALPAKVPEEPQEGPDGGNGGQR